MHLVNPNLFIMWDRDIREYWGCACNARGYLNFIIVMQQELNELVQDYAGNSGQGGLDGLLAHLNGKINQHNTTTAAGSPAGTEPKREYSITRWLDIYNWTNIT